MWFWKRETTRANVNKTDPALASLFEGFWKVLSNDVATPGANIRSSSVSRKKRRPESGSAVLRDLINQPRRADGHIHEEPAMQPSGFANSGRPLS